jgi:hypothetical protein
MDYQRPGVAQRLAAHHWPLVKHDGRAEAALIGHRIRTLNAVAAAPARAA